MQNHPSAPTNSEEFYGYTIPMQEFFRCALSVDCVLFGKDETEDLKVLLIKRGAEPFLGEWALPGDLMYPYENLNDAAVRVLKSLTGLDRIYMEQVSTFGDVHRHPIGRVITVGYFAFVNIAQFKPRASSWAEQLEWHNLKDTPGLAFDHNEILEAAHKKLKKNLWEKPIGYNLLPQKFTLNDIQQLYQSILGNKLDKANFRKKVLATHHLIALEELQSNVPHRPAKLYKFDDKIVEHHKI